MTEVVCTGAGREMLKAQSMHRRISVIQRSSLLLCLAVLLHTAVWTLYGSLTEPSAIHPDTAEAYVWGREFLWGYYNHPPVWAWLAGLWFKVWPRTNWAFYALSEFNAALALMGVWLLVGCFVSGAFRLGATLLLLATPFYTFFALKFNANTILLSLWPWTVYFFISSIERGRLIHALMFGAFASSALLSKYFSAILLVCCFVASLLHANRRRYYRSVSPYLSVVVCLAMILPHVVWLFDNDFLPFKHIESLAAYSDETILWHLMSFAGGGILFNTGIIGLVWLARRLSPATGDTPAIDPTKLPYLLVLAVGPYLLTIEVAIVGHIRLSPSFSIPIFFLVPLITVLALCPDSRRLMQIATIAGALVIIVPLAASPLIHSLRPQFDKGAVALPLRAVAERAVAAWHETTSAPLRLVAGSPPYATEAAFYSGEDTSEFIGFDMTHSPWVSANRIKEQGLLVICAAEYQKCSSYGWAYADKADRSLEIEVDSPQGSRAGPVAITLFIIVPN